MGSSNNSRKSAFFVFQPATTPDNALFDLPEGWEFKGDIEPVVLNDNRIVVLVEKK